jgi:hypothetical protein
MAFLRISGSGWRTKIPVIPGTGVVLTSSNSEVPRRRMTLRLWTTAVLRMKTGLISEPRSYFDLPSKPRMSQWSKQRLPCYDIDVKVQNAAQLEGEENGGSPELPRLAARRKATECIMLSAFGAQNGAPAYEVAIVNFGDTSSSGTFGF